MSIAIIWQRFGPYHLARLQGARFVFQRRGYACLGIQIAGRDHYPWQSVQGETVTLFPNEQYESISPLRIRRAVRECLQRLEPAVVAVNGWSVPEALAAPQWCTRRGRPAILMSETHEPSGRWWKEMVKRWRVRRCSAALVGGTWHADYLKSLGFPASRIVCGYDAVDNEYFRSGSDQARNAASALRCRHALPARYFYANTRFLPRKNIDGLLRAFAAYRCMAGLQTLDGSKLWKLVISGAGEMERAWRALAASLGVAEAVVWPGFVQYDELPIYYGLASAFIHPAHREAWGLVVNEAAAAGLPLIVGHRVGAACELVQDGENGYLFDTHGTAQLADAMMRISSLDDRRRTAMGDRSRQIVARFGPAQFGEALWTAWQKAQPGKCRG